MPIRYFFPAWEMGMGYLPRATPCLPGSTSNHWRLPGLRGWKHRRATRNLRPEKSALSISGTRCMETGRAEATRTLLTGGCATGINCVGPPGLQRVDFYISPVALPALIMSALRAWRCGLIASLRTSLLDGLPHAARKGPQGRYNYCRGREASVLCPSQNCLERPEGPAQLCLQDLLSPFQGQETVPD